MADRYIPTIKYSWLQGSFWMSFCIVFNYASVFLLSRGYSNSQIGIVIAVAGVISTLLQPIVAGLADRSRRLTLRTLVMILAVCMLAGGAALLPGGLHFFLLCPVLWDFAGHTADSHTTDQRHGHGMYESWYSGEFRSGQRNRIHILCSYFIFGRHIH